ncbi:MAG: integrin alpha [Deltaproteobacteria bacterium]
MGYRVLFIASVGANIIACSGGTIEPPATRDGGFTRDAGFERRDGGPRDAGSQIPDGGAMLEPCAPALSVTPTTAAVLPFGLYTVRPQGGTGAYRFALEANESDAIINALSGAYLAGGAGGSVDRVLVTDDGCIGETRVDVRVVEPLQIRPFDITAPPATSWRFVGVGGTGDFTFALLVDGTGATLTADGNYTAGMAEGTDRIQLVDNQTGQTSEATVVIANDATMAPAPPFVFVAAGQTFDLDIVGGSGFVEVVESVTTFALEDGRIVRGLAPGRSQVTLRDVYTGQTAPFRVQTAASQSYTPVRFGPQLSSSRTLAAGDLDGDGFDDVIASTPEGSANGYLTGAVLVYRGSAAGIDPTPAQVLTGETRRDLFGNDVAIGDFDEDGETDLVVGVPRLDIGGTDVGAAIIYKGIAGGFFETTPWRTLSGRFSGDDYGWSVEVCDFDDDGKDDIAIGGYRTEDRVRPTRANDQGGAFVYFNGDTGFADLADQIRWGDVPDGSGGWTGVAGMRFATELASGDINGDGVCDLVVGAHEWDQTTNTNDGLVMVFAGSAMGVSERPVLAWANDNTGDRGGQFGRRIAIGDIDIDGKDDLAISNFAYDNGNSDQHGAIRVFRGRDFAGPIDTLTSYTPADFEYLNPQSFDWFGFAPAIGDVTGDGVADLVTGNPIDEAEGGPGASGTIAIFVGREAGLPDPAVEPIRIGTETSQDRIGLGVAIVRDVDGDRRNDIVTFSAYGGTEGVEVGAPWVVTTGDTPTATPLDHPGEASGGYFGSDAAIVGDVNGDGFEDLVVGAEQHPGMGRVAGGAFLYTGSAAGFANSPALELTGFTTHSAGDYFGRAVAPAGDFDDDGVQDFAVIARFEDRPASFNTNNYVAEASCAGSQNNPGAVYVFRGSANGLPSSEPAFIYYGPVAGDGLNALDGGFDFNGDGFDDLVVGNYDDDENGGNAGMVAVVAGRARDTMGRITVICDPYVRSLGRLSNDQLGLSVAAIGDVNQDGCDDLAAGAPFADPMANNEGVVRVLFGFGGVGCLASPMMTSMRSTIANAQSGYALGGGNVDVDGDGRPELAIGLPFLAAGGNSVGGTIVAYGAYIDSLPKIANTNAPTAWAPFLDAGLPPLVAVGRDAGEEAGRSVALIGGGTFPAAVVVGSPRGDVGGVTQSGGARVFLYTGAGLSAEPVASFGGETTRTQGLIGWRTRAGWLNGAPAFVVGGYDGSGVARDSGSAYAFDFQ